MREPEREPQAPEEAEARPGLAARLDRYQRAGGLVTPLVTTIFAFFVGGLVVLVITGKNPLSTYLEIFNGTGLNWLLPWETCAHPCGPALSLQQTLLQLTTLTLTALAVAFAFRCGLFNIGGQGQYILGALAAVQTGIWFESLPALPHVVLAVAAAALAGAVWAGIAGLLKATVGAHEVISTIMLNWTAVFVVTYLVSGPLFDPVAEEAGAPPITEPVAESARLPVIWGSALLQGLHVGLFVALAALVLYWVVLNRTTLGYEVRAVGLNPDAAAYGGIPVARRYVAAMAISGSFAGTAGAMDILGWQHTLDETAVTSYSQIAFIGIAVALLGRTTMVGIFFAGLLFAALQTGTSTRNLNPEVFRPELAGNLTEIIQGLIILLVAADLLVLYLWQARRRLLRRRLPEAAS
ncbi:MAG TPA: ABC transporter permease [Gaiellaceae bacterium]|nr:ABC transporter permease [Gaiellaceae bacterium]